MSRAMSRAMRRAISLRIMAILPICLASLATVAAADETSIGSAGTPGAEQAAADRETLFRGWPAVLNAGDRETYRRIFEAQKSGDWGAASRLIETLGDRRLMGYVLSQRYLHPTKYRSKFHELRDWMAAWADLPDAHRIYRLARRRQPADAGAPKPPEARLWTGRYASESFPGAWRGRVAHWQAGESSPAARRLTAQIHNDLRRFRITISKDRLYDPEQGAKLYTPTAFDEVQAAIAGAYFVAGKDHLALDLSRRSAARSGDKVPSAYWTAGLAAWRLGQIELAASAFEGLARAERAGSWQQAAGAFWAARAYLADGRPQKVQELLVAGAGHNRTFYGILCRYMLGLDATFDWSAPAIPAAARAALLEVPAVARAVALAEIDQQNQSERELRIVFPSLSRTQQDQVLVLALDLNLAGLAMRIGGTKVAEGEDYLDAALYPLPVWHPEDGYKVDRALIYAVTRQESRFNAYAKSHAGARGLMQLMPATASSISGTRAYRYSRRNDLYEPALNLSLGQKYLQRLLASDDISGNLFLMAAAYNGGSGNLRKWMRETDYADDPLLFIESIPAPETRDFIERVLTNLWIYRARLGQDAPSLAALANGGWPVYRPQDEELAKLSD
ncbi:MAG: lytic transglycosylase domain-containing protein [Alphaproteobacteria bacterium]